MRIGKFSDVEIEIKKFFSYQNKAKKRKKRRAQAPLQQLQTMSDQGSDVISLVSEDPLEDTAPDFMQVKLPAGVYPDLAELQGSLFTILGHFFVNDVRDYATFLRLHPEVVKRIANTVLADVLTMARINITMTAARVPGTLNSQALPFDRVVAPVSGPVMDHWSQEFREFLEAVAAIIMAICQQARKKRFTHEHEADPSSKHFFTFLPQCIGNVASFVLSLTCTVPTDHDYVKNRNWTARRQFVLDGEGPGMVHPRDFTLDTIEAARKKGTAYEKSLKRVLGAIIEIEKALGREHEDNPFYHMLGDENVTGNSFRDLLMSDD